MLHAAVLTHQISTRSQQSDNVFFDLLGCLKFGDFGEVSAVVRVWHHAAVDLTHCCPTQARSDYGKMALFFRTSGKPIDFIAKTQIGFGAAQATAPEVKDALSEDGSRRLLNEGVPLWELMRGNDTWAAGRIIMESLLQCIHGEAEASAAVLGMPPLTAAKYKHETCRPCLATVLPCGHCHEHDESNRLTPE